jgi:competence protein ComFC
MLDIFLRIWNTIAPPHPLVQKLQLISATDFCRHYHVRLVKGAVCLSSYQDPLVRATITANKFHNDTHAALLLSTLLSMYLSSLSQQPTTLIPIPLSLKREKKRGYNQVTRVLTKLPTGSFYTVTPLLIRTHDTKPQTSLKRQERLQNTKTAFAYDHKYPLNPNTRYIIVDDVHTTGATLQAAKEALYSSLPQSSTLICLSLAH